MPADYDERQYLTELAAQPVHKRVAGYIRIGGPGWLQGAMTLGGGSAITSLTIGGVYGYEYLWLQPVAMLIACIMLFALSHQTLSTGEWPYQAMKKHLSPTLAWFWAVATLIAAIVWGFSHYPLAAGMLEEIIEVSSGFEMKSTGGAAREIYLLALAIGVWCVCAYTGWHYGAGGRAVKLFENAIKILSGTIILSFIWVVASAHMTGNVAWGAVMAGFIPSSFPTSTDEVTTMMAVLGSAVGINATFVYGYSLLQRGWGKEHRAISRFDIVSGLVLPYMLVTTLITIAAAGAFAGSDMDLAGKLNPAQASQMFVNLGMGEVAGRLVFAFGILGMVAGSLVMHMLCAGAAAAELFGWEINSRKYQWGLMLPTPAVLGVFFWSTMGAYVILPVSALTAILLPIAYIGWFIMNNSKSYLGDDMPVGRNRFIFNTAMAIGVITVIASVVFSLLVKFGIII